MMNRRDRHGDRRGRVRRLALVLSALLLGATGATPAAAQTGGAAPAAEAAPVRDPAAAEEARRAIGLVRSPYCPGLMLEVCPSPQAEALRDSMRTMAAEGMPSDELVEWMIASHGEEWRAVPKRRGAGIWAWLLPPIALVFGAGLVTLRVRSLRGSGPAGTEPALEGSLSDDDRARLDAALREMERVEEDPR